MNKNTLKNVFTLTFVILLLSSCTHYKSISFDELESRNLIGKWEMSLPPYHLTILCDGTVSFVKPSKYLYADQTGSKFVITQIKNHSIITGPVIRYDFQVEEWPHEEDGEMRMTVDGRMWHRSSKFKCE